MDPNDAAATGALANEVNPADLRQDDPQPKHRAPITDPMWYLAANDLAPHMESTRKRGWIDGFVAGLEAARQDDDYGEVLRDSIGMTMEVPVAIREPRPLKADAESLAKFMFERQAETYDAEPGMVDEMWADPGVHEFWLSEARAVLRFLP